MRKNCLVTAFVLAICPVTTENPVLTMLFVRECKFKYLNMRMSVQNSAFARLFECTKQNRILRKVKNCGFESCNLGM